MIITLLAIAIAMIAILLFLQHPKFGKYPSGERLKLIEQASNYKNGAFQNISHTPDFAEGVTIWTVLYEFLFERKKRLSPASKIPSIKTDLLNLDIDEDVLVWFGHSSYFMQIDGKRMLVDPVFGGFASPLPIFAKAYDGTNIYDVEDFPEIDILFITHDHWDHLDYETILKLKSKVRLVICGLGVGEHLEHWGYEKSRVIEKNWNEELVLPDGFVVNTAPARHFSGRGFSRNKSLWLSYLLKTPTMKIFIGGDSGYDSHFAEIGNKFGEFDLAILENGQYDRKWRYIHILPDELLKVAKELKAKRILPVHSAKFALANHAWDEPLELISQNSKAQNINTITPMIGEVVRLKDTSQVFSKWWLGIE